MAPPNTNPPPPKLSLHTLPTNHHHHHLPPPPTPPHRSSASVPFAWELIPGKPRHTSSSSSTTTTIATTQPKSLNPPPNLHLLSSSPTAVLDGPYLTRSDSPSLRRLSFVGGGGGGGGGVIRGKTGKEKDGGLLRKWGVRLRSEAPHSVSSSSSSSLSSEVVEEDEEDGGATKVKITRFRRNGNSFSLTSTRTTTHFWGSIYENIKQAVHRRG